MGTEKPDLVKHRPLTKTQFKTASLIAQGNTRRQAAAATGTPERTLYKWLKRPDFRELIRHEQEAFLAVTFSALIACGRGSVLFLDKVVRGEVGGDNLAIRVRAAQALLNGLGNIYKLRSLEKMAMHVRQLDEVQTFIKDRVDLVLEAFKGHPAEKEKFLAALKAKDEQDEHNAGPRYR